MRWTPASGELSHVFDDELVCASRGRGRAASCARIEPFPTDTLVPYDPGYLVRLDGRALPDRSRGGGATSRAQQMDGELRPLCAQQVPGDTYRNLRVDAAYRDQTFKHILVPVWLLTYVYGAKSYQVVVNGVTGRIAGNRPWSGIKVALVVALAILLFVLISTLNH